MRGLIGLAKGERRTGVAAVENDEQCAAGWEARDEVLV